MVSRVLSVCLGAASAFGISAAAKAGSPVKEWTFLVYLDGDNNLDPYGDTNMQQMEAIGSTADVNVIVLRDKNDQSISTKIYSVGKGKSTVVKDYGKNIDMGDWHTLVDFFQFAKDNYPANHYVVDVWDHGGGWGIKPQAMGTKDISWDDGTGNAITTAQLGQAMAQIKTINGGKNIDIIGMDACLMQMGEVVMQVAPSVNVMAASEQTEPDSGWDYTASLKFLTENPKAPAADIAAHIQKDYVAINTDNVQGSAVVTSALVAAAPKIAAFADQLMAMDKLDKTTLGRIIGETQGFEESDFRDFLDFVTRIKAATKDVALTSAADTAEQAVKQAVVASYLAGSSLPDAHGLSVWLPDSGAYSDRKDKYKELDWAQQTHWMKLLDKLYQ